MCHVIMATSENLNGQTSPLSLPGLFKTIYKWAGGFPPPNSLSHGQQKKTDPTEPQKYNFLCSVARNLKTGIFSVWKHQSPGLGQPLQTTGKVFCMHLVMLTGYCSHSEGSLHVCLVLSYLCMFSTLTDSVTQCDRVTWWASCFRGIRSRHWSGSCDPILMYFSHVAQIRSAKWKKGGESTWNLIFSDQI